MHKLHTPDLLSDKISSRFVALIGSSHSGSITPLWNTLIHKQMQHRPCIIVTSGELSYSCLKGDCINLHFLHTDDIDNSEGAFKKLRDIVSNRDDSQPVCIFMECVPWFFLDCPNDFEFGFYTRHVISLMFDLAIQPMVKRLTVVFNPIQSTTGAFLSYSSDICTTLEQCATSILRCGKPNSVTSGPNECCVQLPLTVCHKRSAQHAFSHLADEQPSIVNKPALFEKLVVDIDVNLLEFVGFHRVVNDLDQPTTQRLQQQPEASFALQLTDSERIARAQVALPYEFAQTEISSSHPVDDVQIHYQPDCFDDFDDEDPDDDLNI
ncbi:hypothetical protein CSKR_109245 [Clonorchis sinensis]|uniref:Elongator complex protein 5 n=1 Tax=Clonorchis sinensis TaxID=79923 RepID=A0A419QGE9_CLOSI|nr:hypothetical protein CSKR_109245 [Clonorchis sinensis]